MLGRLSLSLATTACVAALLLPNAIATVPAEPQLIRAPPVLVVRTLMASPGILIPFHEIVACAFPAATDDGIAPDSLVFHIVVGLKLRDQDDLEANPRSSQDQFNARYAPTAEQEQRVIDHLVASGFTITERFSNRLLVDAVGNNAAMEKAWGVQVHNVSCFDHKGLAALGTPIVPADLAPFVVGVIGPG